MYKKIGIIGAGTMGIGLAVDLVFHGKDVVLVDVKEEVLEAAKSEVSKMLRFAPMVNRKLPKIDIVESAKKVVYTTDLNDVSTCDYIIENVTENWDIKKEVYKKLSQICSEQVCFAANTSCISITKIAGITNREKNVVGIHFMNPVYMKDTVEMIKGHYTSEKCIEETKQMLQEMSKRAVIVNDSPGFVSNRLSHLFMNEAAFIVQEGVATASQVDEIFKNCFGHKMGPLETADLIGLDTVMDSIDVLYDDLKDSKFRCCPLLRKMVNANLLGRKTGQGFHKYS